VNERGAALLIRKSEKILHILRSTPDERTKETIMNHSQETDVTVLLIQEGVLTGERMPELVLALEEDVKKRKLSQDLPLIDYASMVRILFGHDRVICG
jgi:sulfur transfer complex TusBCD TusB component (DsrH family)